MPNLNKLIIKGKKTQSTQSSGLASRGVPVKGPKDVTPHNDAFEGKDIEQKGTVNYSDSRYR